MFLINSLLQNSSVGKRGLLKSYLHEYTDKTSFHESGQNLHEESDIGA